MKRLLVSALSLMLLSGCSAKEKVEKDGKPVANETAEHDKNTVSLDVSALKSAKLEIEVARILPIASSVLATAVVKPNETRVAHLKLLSRGQVTRLDVRVGDRVRAGQSLLVYDNAEAGELIGEYRSAVAAMDKATAEAELSKKSVEATKKSVDVTKKSLERGESLVGVGGISTAEVDRRSADYKNAEATADMAEASVGVAVASLKVAQSEVNRIGAKLRRFGLTVKDLEDLARTSSDPTVLAQIALRAPFDGVVTAADVAEGEIIDPSQDLMTITDLSTVWVLGDVYDRDVAQVRSGQDSDVLTDAYPSEVFHCRITNIGDSIDPQTRTAKVRCEAPNLDGRLKLDMFARIRLRSSVTHQALAIPDTAIQVIDGKSYVFVPKDESSFERREVMLGVRSGTSVEILSGLMQGDMVVTQGSFLLKSVSLKDRIGGDEN